MPETHVEQPISMRRTKIKAEEAALLAGELKKPSWQSKNEGIHERVSFEDTIWGFDLAGGVYYKTPLRVTYVKQDSRADKAGIRPGDKLLRINDIDTSTLTIQEAHDIIVESGIHIKLAVTAPEDEEDSYNFYEDPIEDEYDSEEERWKEEEKARRRQVHAKVSSYWSLQWPWVSKRRIIWRESNCYMVPSKYESKHSGKFTPQPMIRTQDDIVLHSAKGDKDRKRTTIKDEEESQTSSITETPMTNGHNGVQDTDGDLSEDDLIDSIKQSDNHEMINNDNELNKDDNDIEEENSSHTNNGVENFSESVEHSIDDKLDDEHDINEISDDQMLNEIINSEATEDDDRVLNSILSDNELKSESER